MGEPEQAITRRKYYISYILCPGSTPVINSIQSTVNEDEEQIHTSQKQIRAEVHQTNCQKITSHSKEVRGSLPQNCQATVEQSCEDGASSCITAIPDRDFGFNLHKQAFYDDLCHVTQHCSPLLKTLLIG